MNWGHMNWGHELGSDPDCFVIPDLIRDPCLRGMDPRSGPGMTRGAAFWLDMRCLVSPGVLP